MKHALIGIILCIILSGCETIIDLDVPGGYQPRLVVNSTFTPANVWSLALTQSAPFGDTRFSDDLIVPNANVIILGEDDFRDTLKFFPDEGVYQSVYENRPQKGETYHLKITAPGFADVEATSHVPILTANLLSIDSDIIKFEYSNDIASFKVRINIDDQPGENYYRLALYQVVSECSSYTIDEEAENDASPDSLYFEYHNFQSNSPLLHAYPESVDDPTYSLSEDSYRRAFFSDKLFEGTTREFSITSTYSLTDSTGNYFMIEVALLSNDIFAYERTVGLHDSLVDYPNVTQRNPVVVYSNVQNGFGIFAAYASTTFRFDQDGNEWQETDLGVENGEIKNCDNF